MTELDKFIRVALKMGIGRMMGSGRMIPVFVPEGNYQDALFVKSVEWLVQQGFKILDCRNNTYEQAINSFNLNWPVLADKWPSEEYMVKTDDKLLILCGKESHPRFWKYLSTESILYTGSALPPSKSLSPRCIVIPDSACVAAIAKHEDFYEGYSLEYFGPVGTFNSNTVPFYI